jgi:undecaprenyl-diphosphatase
MTLLHTIILGIVEGLTEFLPVSSTGHMILVSHFLHIPEDVALTTFEIAVQVGAILAVVVTYYKKLFDIEMIKKLILAFIPTGVVGLFVFPYIKNLLTSPIIVASMLVLGGLCIIILEHRYEKQTEEGKIIEIFNLSYKNAFILGVLQSLAIIPGVSRSGAMIMGGLVMRLSRTMVTQFTFLLAVPTMIVATVYTLIKKHSQLSMDDLSLIVIGSSIAFVVALVVIRVFLEYIRRHSFQVFGWYRIIVGIILLFVLV